MQRGFNFPGLIRLSLRDPVAGGRAVLALDPPMAVRWMMLAASILASVVLLYALPVMLGMAGGMPSPVVFAGASGLMNLVAIVLITHVGGIFGGTGRFHDTLWLMAWLQMLTVGMLAAQLAVLVLIPALNTLVTLASVALSIWLLTGFICALHGFKSQLLVLVGGMTVLMVVSVALSFLLLLLGVDPTGGTNV
ncbi:MAG: hypothetical protein Kow0013_24700 [Pararhodobacter sp.]